VNLKRCAPLSRRPFEYATDGGYKCRSTVCSLSLSLVQPITLSLCKLSLLQRIASNDNGKRKLEEEAESSTARKRLQLSDDDDSDDDSSDSLKKETEEEVSSEKSSMKLDTSKEKLLVKRDRGMIFSDDGDTTLPSSEPHTPISRRGSDEDINNEDDDDDDDDFWM
jgi:hypothetical protein